ncbi:MAG: hypothetical protein ABFC28_06165 [Rikenellaceae bacterium]
MGAFFTFIFILILVFWLVARFGPLLLGWWIKRKVNKFAGQGKGYSAGDERYREGETIVNSTKLQEKVVDKNVGEYVDFEETKEDTKDQTK